MASKIIKSGPSPVEEGAAASGGEISSREAGASEQKVIEQPVHDAQQRARELLREAHGQANRIIEAAESRAEARLEQVEEQVKERLRELETEAARVREQARMEGHDEGFARWQRLLMDVHSSRRELIEELQQQIVRLALQVGAKLHRSSLDGRPEEILPLVRDSLQALGGVRGEIQVHAHPEDAAAIETSRTTLVDQDPRWASLIVVHDDTVSRGGCRVVSALGSVDATVESQLRAIEDHLLHDDGRGSGE